MTATYEPNVVLSEKEFDVVGTRPIRHDGADKVTGAAKYGADFYAAGMLFGKVLRSPHSHARIKSVDTSKAEAVEGVRAVVKASDLPHDEWTYAHDEVMAKDKVLYKGHPIAGVAATNIHAAEHAVGLIEVEYEVLPPVLTAPEAMKENAPILHQDVTTEELGVKSDKVSNVAQHFQHSLGDVDKGFAEADVVIDREFNTATVHQGYIEPHNFNVNWNKDGRVQIWLSTQGAFDIRDATATVLDLPVSTSGSLQWRSAVDSAPSSQFLPPLSRRSCPGRPGIL